jgi:2'-5' RNA ligase
VAVPAIAELTAGFNRGKIRRVPSDQIHMTVLFLGDRPAAELDAITAKARDAAAGTGPVTLTPTRVLTLPENPPPRVLALEAAAPHNLHALYKRLIALFPALGDHPHRATILPHFTLARFRPNSNGKPVSTPVNLPTMEVTEIHLIQSLLKPEGPEHTSLATLSLA